MGISQRALSHYLQKYRFDKGEPDITARAWLRPT